MTNIIVGGLVGSRIKINKIKIDVCKILKHKTQIMSVL